MEDKLYGAWLMDLANYFIKKQKYQMVTMSQSNDEVWLVNPSNKQAPIVMISSLPTQRFDQERIEKQRETLAIVFQTSPVGINISTNPMSERFDELNVGVNPSFKSSSGILKQFLDIDSVLKEDGNADIMLARSIMNLKRTLARTQGMGATKLYGTRALVVLSLIVSIPAIILYALFPSDAAAYVALGAFYKPLVVNGLEVWRFVTSAFVNVDVIELLLSLMIIRNAGRLIEPQLGWKKFLGLFFVGVIFGNLIINITNDVAISVGVINGVCTLLGYLFVYIYEVRAYRNSRVISYVFNIIFVAALYLMLPTVSLTAMLSCVYLGLLMGFAMSRRKDWESIRKVLRIAVPVFVVGMGVVALFRPSVEVSEPLTLQLVDIFNKLKLDFYANHLRQVLK